MIIQEGDHLADVAEGCASEEMENIILRIRGADEALGAQEILSEAEHGRLALMHEGARPAFVTARAMLRTALGDYMGLLPAAVPLTQEGAGRVFIEGFDDNEPPFYSVSHTGGAEDSIAAVAVAESCAIGIDIQQIDPVVAWRKVAQRRFPAAEWEILDGMPEEEGRMLFFMLWAIKESFVKMENGKLMPYLQGIELEFGSGLPTLKTATPGGCKDATIFFHFVPEYQLAVALVAAKKAEIVLDCEILKAQRSADPFANNGDGHGHFAN